MMEKQINTIQCYFQGLILGQISSTSTEQLCRLLTMFWRQISWGEDEGSRFLQNVGKHEQYYKMS